MAASPRVLCRLDEIPDGGSKGFDLGPGHDPREIFVVREGRRLHAYVNSCPHLGTPLEFTPDQFLSHDGSHILCSTHGALFEIEDGTCIAGPCMGDSLQALPVALDEQERVFVTL